MSEMTERVAQAISGRLVALFAGEDLSSEQIARTAIEAMREPTEAMLSVGTGGSDELRTWHLMIDEALS